MGNRAKGLPVLLWLRLPQLGSLNLDLGLQLCQFTIVLQLGAQMLRHLVLLLVVAAPPLLFAQ